MKIKMMKSVFACAALMSLLFTACGSDDGISDIVVSDDAVDENDVNSDDVSYGSFVDARDGQQYKTVKIGSQTWMAQNLNYFTGNSLCYDYDDANCGIYGQLYTWDDAQTACPQGWHLPSKEEFEVFLEYTRLQILSQKKQDMESLLDGDELAIHLRDASWNGGLNTFGFSALPAGSGLVGSFSGVGEYAIFWSASQVETNGSILPVETKSTLVYKMTLRHDFDFDIVTMSYGDKFLGYSVRCLQD